MWPGWMEHALCRTVGTPEDWFPDAREDAAAEARAVCAACPVRRTCLDYAISIGEYKPHSGIWGGTGPTRRKKLARQRRREAA
jgi:WhiB family transcriptional regulator, redox-sensing transcriptional regulator